MFNYKTTIDDFFDGKLQILQPILGFRSGQDAVLLAANAEKSKGRVLDVGCGCGIAGFCFLSNNKKANLTGIDIQENFILLAKANAQNNEFAVQSDFKIVDVNRERPEYQTYDAVLTNPPFFKEGHGLISPFKIKQIANTGHIDLSKWIDFCFKSLKDKGDFTIIFSSDRLAELLSCMYGKFGDIEIIPLYPKKGKNAKRVIIKAKKNTRGITKITSGIILHNNKGKSAINRILRKGKRK